MDDAIFTAALAALAREGWAGLRPDRLAEAGIPLDRAYEQIRDPLAVLREAAARADRAMLQSVDAASPPRDRLFEAAMARFDALAPARPALRRLARAPESLLALPALLPGYGRTLAWMLAAAELPAQPLRVARLGALYPAVLRAWLGDDSPDLGATMKALERMLDRLGFSGDIEKDGAAAG